MLNGFVNLAQFEIIRRLKLIDKEIFSKEFPISLTAGTNNYDLPNDHGEFVQAWWEGWVRKVPLAEVPFYRDNDNYGQSAADAICWIIGSKIYTKPTPTETSNGGAKFILGYIQDAVVLANDDAETILKEKFLEPLFRLCEMWCAPTLGRDTEKAREHYEDWFKKHLLDLKIKIGGDRPAEKK